jgi:NMD protein affecting ribosome stability and mRNA decay
MGGPFLPEDVPDAGECDECGREATTLYDGLCWRCDHGGF